MIRVFLLSVVCVLVGCASEGDARLTSDGRYQSYEAERGWCTIMLPGTVFGMTTTVVEGGKSRQVGETKSKPGHPTRPDEYTNEELKAIQVLAHRQVSDGRYVVLKIARADFAKHDKSYTVEELQDHGATWTVWEPDTLTKYQNVYAQPQAEKAEP